MSATTSSTTCRRTRTASPGIAVQRVFVRRYPHGTLGAHIVGNVGEIGEAAAEGGALPRLAAGRRDRPGRRRGHLRPLPARQPRYDQRIQVDAFGQPTRNGRLISKPPVPGDNLELTIDSAVQEAGEAALAARGLPGGFVTMNVHSGADPRPRLLPDLRSLGLHQAADPGAGRRAVPRPGGGADHRPGDRRPLPDRLDLQAHHRDGGAGKRRDHAELGDLRRRLVRQSAARASRTPAAPPTAR